MHLWVLLHKLNYTSNTLIWNILMSTIYIRYTVYIVYLV